MSHHRSRVVRVLLAVAALGTAGTAPVQAGPPAVAWGWVTIRQPSVVVSIEARNRGNSVGGINTYTRGGPGDWTVTFPDVGSPAGTAFVSPFRTDRLCTLHAQNGFANDVSIRVLCTNESGTPSDTRFSLIFINADANVEPLGHFWADHPGGSPYTVDPFYTFNSDSQDNRVQVLATGRWKVRFKGLGASGGHLQITPQSINAAFPLSVWCQVESWGSTNGDLTGTVACYDQNGDPADVRFYAAYMRGTGWKGDGGSRVAYLLAGNKSAAAPYAPTANRSFSSSGDPITIDRFSDGLYEVTIEGMQRGGAAVVTAFGTNGHRCSIGSIRTNATPQIVDVKCVDANGDLADTKFLLSWVK